jgi:type IV secretory pathway component VirB8
MTCLSIHARKSALLERSGRRGSELCDRTESIYLVSVLMIAIVLPLKRFAV